MNPLDWDAPWVVIFLVLFGIVMARANGTYWIGRAISAGTSKTRHAALLETTGYLRAERWIGRWGAPVVAVSFLTIGVQTLVNLAAGASRMSLRRYLPAVTVGCVLWAIIYSTVGFVSWRAFAALHQRSPGLAWTVIVAGLVALAVIVVTSVRRERGQRVVRAAVDDESSPATESDTAQSSPR